MSSLKSVIQLPKIIASSLKIHPVAISRQFIAPNPVSSTRIRHSSTTSTNSPTRPCPSCSTPLPIPSSPCSKCNSIIPIPSGLSHHSLLHLSSPIASTHTSEVFDIPAELSKLPAYGFDLDIKGLRGNMLKRQMELHPDKYSGNETDVRLARELSGRVNGAYEVLRDPLKRAEYLLSTQQFEVEETESLTDPMLLAEILEAREELEMASSPEEVDELRLTNQAKVDETIASLKKAFSGDPPNLVEAKSLAVQLKYWQGLENAAKEWSPQ